MHQGVRNILFPSLLLLLVLTVRNINSLSINNKEVFHDENLDEQLRYQTLGSFLDNLQDIIQDYKDNQSTVNDTCHRDLGLLSQALERGELWALKMLDASSKIPSGILLGNIVDLGMFDECIGIVEHVDEVEIRGRHCMYNVKMDFNNDYIFTLKLSICVPANCTADILMSIINKVINSSSIITHSNLKDNLTLESVTCSSIDENIWSMDFIICTYILIGYVGFLIMCTMCDIYFDIADVKQSSYPLLQTFGSFSLRKSVLAIFNTEIKKGTLSIINGIRFLSMVWVILGHRYLWTAIGIAINKIVVLDWFTSWRSLYIYTAPFAVDTFFAISGLLMSYVFFKQIPKQKTFNIPMYYLHRYLRLTPAVIAIIIFTSVFVPKISSGPNYETNQSALCRTKWWPYLLYVQNFIDSEFTCMSLIHLWYLAVDMQLFWISPIILYPLHKNRKIGLAILGFLFFISLIVPAVNIGINRYPITSFINLKNQTIVGVIFNEIYQKPYNRASAWLIGTFFGFEIIDKNRRFSKTGWFFAIGSFAFCIFGTRFFMDENYKYNIVLETLFGATSRPIWGFGICWIIYASIYNYAEPISSFLSWKLFSPLSRLSYSVYLVHIAVQNIEIFSMRVPKYFADYQIWMDFLSDLIMALVGGFCLCILFESPIIILEKMLLKKKQ